MSFRYLFLFLFGFPAASMRIFSGILSEAEIKQYASQDAVLHSSVTTSEQQFLEVEATVANRVKAALGKGRALLGEETRTGVWEVPVVSYIDNPLKVGLKVSLHVDLYV